MTNQIRGGFRDTHSRPPDRYPPPLKLPEGYLKNGYFDANGNVLPEVIQSWPLDLAQKFLQGKPKLNTAQLRRFYNKVCDIKQRLDSQQSFDSVKEQIYSFGPLAAASVGRENAPQLFKEFIDANLQHAVKSKEHFRRGFALHFQSIVAYVKYLEPKTQGGR